MSTWYLDYVNGDNTNNSGDSFAVTLSASDGVANGTTTFTSAGGGFTGLSGRKLIIPTKSAIPYTISSVTNDTTVILSSSVSAGAGLSFKIGGSWKDKTNGTTAARIAPNDNTHIAKSPAPTSLGQTAQWTDSRSDLYRGTIEATKSIGSSTNASPIVVTINNHGYSNGDVIQINAHTTNTAANGNWIIQNVATNTFELINSTGNGIGGASGTARRINCRCVVLTTSVTQTIDNCGANWTVGTNVTSANAQSTDFKQQYYAIQIVTSAGHAGAGILAYYGLPSSLDLSGYNQVSFWLKNSTSALATSGDLKIRLYSDAACTNQVESFDIPAIPSTSRWIPITLDKGSALSATVQGVAIYANIAMASKTFYVDNIIACKDSTSADSLTLQSLISKNSSEQGGTEGWYTIQSIHDKIVVLDGDVNTLGNVATGIAQYVGTTESVTTYKRETIKTTMSASPTNQIQVIQESGSAGNNIQYQGGYNISNDTQDGETFFDGLNGYGYGIYGSSLSYITLNYLNCYRYYSGFEMASPNNWTISNISNSSNNQVWGIHMTNGSFNTIGTIGNTNNNGTDGISISTQTSTITLISNANNNGTSGINMSAATNINNIYNEITNICCNGNGLYTGSINCVFSLITNIVNNTSSGYGLRLDGYNNTFTITNIKNNNNFGCYVSAFNNKVTLTNLTNNASYGIYFATNAYNNKFYSFTSSSNASGGIQYPCSGKNYIYNCTINDTTEVSNTASFYDSILYSQKHDATANNHWMFFNGGTVNSRASTLTNGSGIEWLHTISSSNKTLTYDPIIMSLAKIAVTANNQVTVKVWCKKGHATNVGARLVCIGGQLSGVPTTVYDEKADDTNEEELSIAFTPTESGVIEVEVWSYYVSGNSTVIFDALTITQA